MGIIQEVVLRLVCMGTVTLMVDSVETVLIMHQVECSRHDLRRDVGDSTAHFTGLEARPIQQPGVFCTDWRSVMARIV